MGIQRQRPGLSVPWARVGAELANGELVAPLLSQAASSLPQVGGHAA
jgi:hypothetical protein